MKRLMLKSKIHRATVTEAVVDYEGSITIDEALMDAANIWENEKVLVADLESGARIETYAIKGKRDSGVICINGAAARKIKEGSRVIIMTFVSTLGELIPDIVKVDSDNKMIKNNKD